MNTELKVVADCPGDTAEEAYALALATRDAIPFDVYYSSITLSTVFSRESGELVTSWVATLTAQNL